MSDRKANEHGFVECLVPGCHLPVQYRLPGGIDFPVCTPHMVAVWEFVEKHPSRHVQEATTVMRRRQRLVEADQADAAETARKAQRKDGTEPGHIYFIRTGGFIKVGWSATLERRLRSYGPDIEVLCHYPATRQDETRLHRQLSPARAARREWYEDGPILADHIAEAIRRHGEPTVKVTWTEPTPAARPKSWARHAA